MDVIVRMTHDTNTLVEHLSHDTNFATVKILNWKSDKEKTSNIVLEVLLQYFN